MYADIESKYTPCLLYNSECRIPVAVISLKDAAERRDVLIERGVPEAWIENYWIGTDMRSESYESLDKYACKKEIEDRNNRPLRSGEVGCAMSHFSVQRWLAGSEYSMALILEDDIIPITEGWMQDLEEVGKALLPHARAGGAFICHLGAPAYVWETTIKRSVRFSGAQPRTKVLLHADPDRTIWRAHAYFVSRPAALRSLALEPKIMTLADDWNERRRVKLIDEIFFTLPALIGQDEEIASQIRPVDHGEGCHPASRQRGFFRRLGRSLQRGTLIADIRGSISFRVAIAVAKLKSQFPYRVA